MGTRLPEGLERGEKSKDVKPLAGGRTSASLHLRAMALEDLDGVARIEVASFSTPWSRETFENLLHADRVVTLVAVAEDDRSPSAASSHAPGEVTVAGYAVFWWVADQGELANLAVDAGRRRLGIGAALLDRALDEARSAGVGEVFLEVRRSNRAAGALYDSRGFRTVGYRRGYYTRPREDARIMMKRIDRE
jgi:ribosomal-protein-alanine N-acetyltransferase